MWKKLKWRKIIILSVLVVLVVISIFVAKDYLEKRNIRSFYESMSTDSAIELGKSYAGSLLENYPYLLDEPKMSLSERGLDHMSVGNAKSKIVTIKFAPIPMSRFANIYQAGKSRGVSSDKLSLLFPKEKNLELIGLSRDGNKIVLQFVYQKDSGAPVLIYDNQVMAFAIDLEYINAENGLRGAWHISDFDYKYNINDYVNWISSL